MIFVTDTVSNNIESSWNESVIMEPVLAKAKHLGQLIGIPFQNKQGKGKGGENFFQGYNPGKICFQRGKGKFFFFWEKLRFDRTLFYEMIAT